MKKIISISIMLMAALIIAGGASAETFELRMTTIATEKDPWGKFILGIGENIKKNTNGTVTVTTYLGGKLGTGADTLKQVARGRISMGGFQLPDVESLIPELGVLATPFIFTSAEQRDCVMDNHLAPHLDAMFQKKGLKLLQYMYAGSAGISATFPVIAPEDVRNIKMRSAMSNFSILFWESVGASAVPLGIVEYPSALQTGLVKGGPIVPVFYVLTGVNKLAPHYTVTDHYYNSGFILINLKTWNRLSKTQQQQVMDSQGSIVDFRKQIRGLETTLLKEYEKAGGPVTWLTPEQRQKWIDALTPHQKKIIKMVGGNSQAMWDTVAKAKASCGN